MPFAYPSRYYCWGHSWENADYEEPHGLEQEDDRAVYEWEVHHNNDRYTRETNHVLVYTLHSRQSNTPHYQGIFIQDNGNVNHGILLFVHTTGEDAMQFERRRIRLNRRGFASDVGRIHIDDINALVRLCQETPTPGSGIHPRDWNRAVDDCEDWVLAVFDACRWNNLIDFDTDLED
ncbi:hypothetical protein K461DRAFT_165140 [Myriangium duriaei CBS 260.36]|uniref:Uncharacterized protein n=1 Tax=Myriangium duriaei CBS 260.36 TaxID=1168546 RepID=A0A9P4J0F1_9PEZI|nr:hypothetical protein K461DRAFT_165140 [Myriangium duriaei CBS 260.36]